MVGVPPRSETTSSITGVLPWFYPARGVPRPPAPENKDFIFHQTPGTKAVAGSGTEAEEEEEERFLRCRFLSLFLLITPRCADCAVPLVSSDARNQDSG